MPVFSLRAAEAADRSVLERLWLMFRHDMSEFSGGLPNADGRFRDERLVAAFTDPNWLAYLLSCDEQPAGFAIVRGVNDDVRVLNSFFVARGARRSGIGLTAVRQIVSFHQGPWQVAFQDANQTAVAFWRRVATDLAGNSWTEERYPVPGRPELPADVWITWPAP